MLAEVAAANAAFGIIKLALQNGKELYDVSASAADYFNSKSVVARKAKRNGNKTQLMAFMELEKLKKQEEFIREWMIYAGRSGLYDDWLKFQSECKRQRAAELNATRRKKAEAEEFVIQLFKWTGVCGTILAVCFFILIKFI